MNKRILLAAAALVPLVFFSCNKAQEIVPEPEEIVSVIDTWTGVDISRYDKTAPLKTPVKIVAGFTETKTHLEMNGTDTEASVVWDDGDQFRMYGLYSGVEYDQGWYYSDFTAQGSGNQVSFNPNKGVPDSPHYHCFYVPLSEKGVFRTDDESWGFGITIPTTQAATAGGVQAGLNYAYARSDSFDTDVHFKNMLALIRFKLSGAAVSTVTSVTLTGASPLAGDCVMVPASDGTPQITFTKAFTGDVSSTSVRLDGSFETDTWYYIAVAPGTQTTMSLVFTDGTNITSKVASKAVPFNRGRITSLGTIDLGDALDGEDPNATIKYKTASKPGLRPVTFVVVPDGFTQEEMSTYDLLAKSAVNTIFNVEPFKSYEEYFNVYIMKVPSNESGARISDGTAAEQNRDCYFESSWKKTKYDDMRANDSKVFNYVKNNCPDIVAGTHSITEVPVLIIINDTRYGGINWTYSDGKAYCMAPYTYSGGSLGWSYPNVEAASDEDPSSATVETPASRYAEVKTNSGNWLNTMVHEFAGHCFSRLGDEYWYEGRETEETVEQFLGTYRWTVPFGLNVSATYTNPGRDAISGQEGWQHLLDRKDELVALDPHYSRIGVFQGGDVSIHNRWRSERVSCMIDNRFYFSTFQRELIVKRILGLAGESFDFDTFLAKDVTDDPLRDVVSSPVLGSQDPVAPRIMPMLPPPRYVEE